MGHIRSDLESKLIIMDIATTPMHKFKRLRLELC